MIWTGPQTFQDNVDRNVVMQISIIIFDSTHVSPSIEQLSNLP